MIPLTDQAVAAYERGDIELKDLLGLSPEYVESLKGRAQFFLDEGHAERALLMLDMLEELDRTDPKPTLAAVALSLSRGESTAAAARVDRLLARRPDLPEALVARAEIMASGGELASAAALLRRVIAADPHGMTVAGCRAKNVVASVSAKLGLA